MYMGIMLMYILVPTSLDSESCTHTYTHTHTHTKKNKQTSNSSSKTRGAAPRTRIIWASSLDSYEPSLKLLRLAELQRTNSSPISNCRRSKSTILFSRNINYNINSLLRLRIGTHIIYIYILYISDECNIPEVEMKT